MNNFSQKLEDSSEEQLKTSTNEHDPKFGLLSSNELTRRSLNKLQSTINAFNIQSSKQTDKMLFLTYLIAFLTAIMVIGLIIQIILAV